MKKIAFLFPGQGSQKPGMGKDVYQEFGAAREVFQLADTITGMPITRICFEGEARELTATVNLQPAITTLNLALLSCILPSGIRPAVCAGHSLGEYSALVAAGTLSQQDCIRLVQERGKLMHKEALRNKGAMQAVIGLDLQSVADIVKSASSHGRLSIANHNAAKQIVISGAPAPIAFAGKLAAEQGGKIIPLRVSGAWHSPLIKGAQNDFQSFLSTIPFNAPKYKVIHNETASEENNPAHIKNLMSRQFCRPVRWFETMMKLIENRVEVFVEIGPGRVLTGLLKKTLPVGANYRVYNIFNVRTLNAFLDAES